MSSNKRKEIKLLKWCNFSEMEKDSYCRNA